MDKMKTYIYLRKDEKCAHCNCIGGFIGEEYKHDDKNWQPPKDWPYEIVDHRKKDKKNGNQ